MPSCRIIPCPSRQTLKHLVYTGYFGIYYPPMQGQEIGELCENVEKILTGLGGDGGEL